MDIWEKLGADMGRHRCLALVGGGGKTTLMYALARQARDAGRTVVVTTTTHIMPHPGLFLAGNVDELAHILAVEGIATLGRFDRPDKLTGAGDLAACLALADVVLAEADGARLHPLKAPAEHEPVIPPCANGVIAVAGMDCVGRPIEAVCHRPERVCALLDKDPGDRVTPADVAALLAHPQGGRKGVGEGRAFRCALNKADTPERAAWAGEIGTLLARRGIWAAATYFTEEEQGGQCWF